MEFLIKPWDHQKKAIELSSQINDLALFFDMGTGKSGTTVNILRQHFAREKRIMRTLIMGPVITVRNWCNEFKLHSKIKDYELVPLSGPGKTRVKKFLEAVEDQKTNTLTRGKIIITNFEALEMEELYNLFLQWKPEIFIADESHKLRNHKSKRAKLAIPLADGASYRYILTGSPIINSPMDIFNQYRILDGGATFGVNFFEFRGRYFEDENKGMPSHIYFPKWIPRQATFSDLNEKIYKKALRVMKKDCLDLPPLIKTRIPVLLGPEQYRLYEEMKRDYITFIKAHEHTGEPRAVVAQMALTKALRLLQIVSGFVKTEEGIEIAIKQNPRLVALTDLLEELTPEHKVIVWATFHHNYKQIKEVCNGLRIDAVELHGGISAAEKNNSINKFCKDDGCRVIIGNQGAGGIGINLVEASYSIFYSRNFSLEHDLQAEARNYRGGSEQHEKITRVDLVAEETIDALCIEALASKLNIADQILNWSDKL